MPASAWTTTSATCAGCSFRVMCPAGDHFEQRHARAAPEHVALVGGEADVAVITERDPGRYAGVAQPLGQRLLTIQVGEVGADQASHDAGVVLAPISSARRASGTLRPLIAGPISLSIAPVRQRAEDLGEAVQDRRNIDSSRREKLGESSTKGPRTRRRTPSRWPRWRPCCVRPPRRSSGHAAGHSRAGRSSRSSRPREAGYHHVRAGSRDQPQGGVALVEPGRHVVVERGVAQAAREQEQAVFSIRRTGLPESPALMLTFAADHGRPSSRRGARSSWPYDDGPAQWGRDFVLITSPRRRSTALLSAAEATPSCFSHKGCSTSGPATGLASSFEHPSVRPDSGTRIMDLPSPAGWADTAQDPCQSGNDADPDGRKSSSRRDTGCPVCAGGSHLSSPARRGTTEV